MNKVITFGELLLRLAPKGSLRFSQASSFDLVYGGGESNVAISLANYSVPVDFVTRLPKNHIGECAMMEMRKHGVGVDKIVWGGERLGIYYLEVGSGTRGSNVVYDRAHSSMATIKKGTINWKEVLQGATWFHWSGITPAISESAAQECLEAIKAAHELRITISTDLNYRSKLWQYGKRPKDIMPELLHYSNIILGDLDTAFFMLGKNKVHPNYQDDKSLPQLYDALFHSCPNLITAATTLRYSIGASHQQIGGVLYDGKRIFTTDVKNVTPVVDRVGSGDAFMGGLIYGLIHNVDDQQRALNLAVAACCLKHTIKGDANLVTLEELEKLIGGDASGSIVR